MKAEGEESGTCLPRQLLKRMKYITEMGVFDYDRKNGYGLLKSA